MCDGTVVKTAKSILNELCQKRGLTPTYRVSRDAASLDHEPRFMAEVLVGGEVATGDWSPTVKAAETSAAAAAILLEELRDDGLVIAEAPKKAPPLANGEKRAKSQLFEACMACDWALPALAVVDDAADGAGFACTCDVAGRGRFEGAGATAREAEEAACAAAVAQIGAEARPLVADARGSLRELREIAVKEGLILEASGRELCMGPKRSGVLRLAPQTGRVGRAERWSELALAAEGIGMSRAEVQDVAAARLLPLLRDCALAIAPAAADAEYAPTQRVVATDDAATIDGWVAEHGGAWVALDSEWVPGMRGLALLQLATPTHCLLASVLPPRHGVSTLDGTPRLRSLLLDPAVPKVGKALQEDWERFARMAGPDAEKTSAWAAGWREVTDLLPFHHTGVSVDALARLFLGRRFALKGSVDHKSWGTWPLGDAQRLYAAADACVVADLVVSIAEKEASEARAS